MPHPRNSRSSSAAADRGWGQLRALVDVRPSERLPAILLFFVFFGVITHFWILKPLKKGIFVGFYDEIGLSLWGLSFTAAQAELLAKVANMGVALGAVALFSLLSRRLQKARLMAVLAAGFVAGEAMLAATANEPSAAWVWTFYLFGDLWTTLMVAAFFAFMNDSVSPSAAKRLYGPVGLGGVVGGVFGTSLLAVWIDALSTSAWLGVGILVTVCITLTAVAAEYRLRSHDDRDEGESEPEPAARGSVLAGARLTFNSGYLFAVAAMVGLYEVVSTLVDFQFTSTVAHYLDGPEIGRHFARVFTVTNIVSLGVQALATSAIMTRFGVGIALAVLPVALLSGSALFLAIPALWPGSLLNTADNGFAYSINQSAKETLYVPTSRREKYEAKAFIDMFVQRTAKAAAVGLSLVVTSIFAQFETVRWLSLATLALGVLWLLAIHRVSREFDARTDEPHPAGEDSSGGASAPATRAAS